MVVFTCGHCGESVQKPKVEKHYLTKCRNRKPNLSCMDCFKDFLGNDYESHTKCITEEERYSGKGFQAKEKKGEKKQNAWVEILQSVLDEQKNAPSSVLRIVEMISKHNNTPRKKPKFFNFVKNICGPRTGAKDIEQAWALISVKLSDLTNLNQNKNESQNNGTPVSNNTEGEVADENGVENSTNEIQNSDDSDENHDTKNGKSGIEENGQHSEIVDKKKLSKKQRKEEKKRQKYEAELQSAESTPPVEGEEDEVQVLNKKGKKKKNRSESSNGEEEIHTDGKNKIKKRKRQDTANSVPETHDNEAENVENIPVLKEKTIKKKLKVVECEEAEDSICLHDQNVAKIEELSMKSENFNWHGAIMAVLEKKGEMPFKRLQKKVLFEYSEATGREVDDRIADKFIKKLKSAPNVRVDKNRVLIVE